MKKWLKRFALTCAIIPLAQCAVLPIGSSASRAAEPVSQTDAPTDADPALWVVKDDDTTIYLFGTVHVLKPGLTWFDDAVKAAFDSSDQLMLEVVMPGDKNKVSSIILPLAIDQNGKTLPSLLTPDQLEAYQAAMRNLGLPAGQFDAFEPWFAAITLSVLPLTKLGYDPEQGAEKLLTNYAKVENKPVYGLETMEEQLGYFDSLPENSQVAFLNDTVKEIDTIGPMLDKMVTFWSQGKTEELAALLNESMDETPELRQILLYNRNARWAEELQAQMAKPGIVFVAVGAGHLAGPHSLQDYLKERGLTVTRITY